MKTSSKFGLICIGLLVGMVAWLAAQPEQLISPVTVSVSPVASVVSNSAADVELETLKAVVSHPITIEEYREPVTKDWRWRARAHNGLIILIGSEGYKRRGTMQRVREMTLLKLATEDYRIVELGTAAPEPGR